MQQLPYTYTLYMWVRASEELCRRQLLCEKYFVGMGTARGSLTLFERYLVFSVGQFNENEIEKSKRN